MKIETKYNINDSAWIIHNNTVVEVYISQISILINENGRQDITYECCLKCQYESTTRRERNMFKSKEELLNSL